MFKTNDNILEENKENKKKEEGKGGSYKEVTRKKRTATDLLVLQGCSVLNLMYKYNTIYQSSPTIKRKLYGSK